jgi:hypothetical protein
MQFTARCTEASAFQAQGGEDLAVLSGAYGHFIASPGAFELDVFRAAALPLRADSRRTLKGTPSFAALA